MSSLHPAAMRIHRVFAPAKVNLTLRVLGRQEDGYHEISSLMAPISLGDTLEIRREGEGLRLEVPGHPQLEGPDNLCARAWEAFRRCFEWERGLRVVLHKEVPMAAGLGGGSSDAGALLRFLAHQSGIPLDDPRLAQAALEVGSDVPFFLAGGPAFVTGRGEGISSAPKLPPIPLVLIHPPYAISAKEAYEALAKARSRGGRELSPPPPLPPLGGPEEVASILANDLQEEVARLLPLQESFDLLRGVGALGTLMSGSGPTVFGVFPTREEAEQAATTLMGRTSWGVRPVTTLEAGATLLKP